MKLIRYIIFFVLFIILLVLNLTVEMGMFLRLLNPLILCIILCFYRVAMGPTPVDRAVAVAIADIVVVGVSGIVALVTKKDFFIDIGLAWGLQAFIGTIALAKYLEGQNLDE